MYNFKLIIIDKKNSLIKCSKIYKVELFPLKIKHLKEDNYHIMNSEAIINMKNG
jgi:hypothetical protein